MIHTAARPAWGWGLATVHQSGQVLDTWFAAPALGVYDGAEAPLMLQVTTDARRGTRTQPMIVAIDLDVAPQSVPDAYLRLHLLSHRLVKPREINLEGIFGVLPNVVWTSSGPCATDDFETVRGACRFAGQHLTIFGVDKFPRMVDYVVPSGVRIADADRVRLGAYLASGTTVMHEGFVNFNAGTLGTSMVEGRISAGVIVGDGTDVGGGASIMGTRSGGGEEVITIGERCLLGAESGVGISLGDDCVIEAGLYVTAGTKVTLPDGRVVKGGELSGMSGLLFLRDSVSGRVEARPRTNGAIMLNDALHANG